MTTATTTTLAEVRERIDDAADALYDLDRSSLDAEGSIAALSAANDLRSAQRALATVTGERTATEFRSELGPRTTRDPTVAHGWTETGLAVESRGPDSDWLPWPHEADPV